MSNQGRRTARSKAASRCKGGVRLLGAATILFAASAAHAQTDVCVQIVQRTWYDLALEESRVEQESAHERARAAQTTVANTAAQETTTDRAAEETAPTEEQGSAGPSIDPEAAAAAPSTESETPPDHAEDNAPSFNVEELMEPARPRIQRMSQRAPATATSELTARAYLRRLFEHYVTHEDGFQAVSRGCAERLTVELYPLDSGWTVFARYSGHSREEKIDRVEFEELDALAQRITRALLADVSVQETLTRTTVLGADSESELRRIRGGKQFLFGLGAVMLFGTQMPTSVSSDSGAEVLDERFRLIVPLQAIVGMRSYYRAWALDSYVGLRLGTSRRSSSTAANNHVDYTAGFTAGMHFLRYLQPAAVSSFYAGGGASFVVDRYRATGIGSSGLWGGGMQLDLVFGHEFMRASSLHFYVEATASVPAYRFDTERSGARIDSYIPSAVLQIGLLH